MQAKIILFTAQPLRAVGVLFSPVVSGWVGGRSVERAGGGKKFVRCATSWSDLDLTFDLAVVTLSLKILSRLYLGNRKVYEVDTW